MRLLLVVLTSLAITIPVLSQIELDVVYPRFNPDGEPPVIGDVDSTFVFGSVKPADCLLLINGVGARIYPNGSFIAYAPVDRKEMVFTFTEGGSGTLLRTLPFVFPQPREKKTLDVKLPVVLKVTNPHSVMRYGDDTGVYYLFPAEGAVFESDRTMGGYFGHRLNNEECVYIEERFVEIQENVSAPPIKKVYSIKAIDFPNEVKITVPSGNCPLHRIVEENNPPRLDLFVYNVVSHIDIIHNNSSYLREIRWAQDFPETMRLSLFPASSKIWGYYTEICDVGNLVLHLRKPPEDLKLKGLIIAIDAGHGGANYGAIGPTRLSEKEINLTLAKKMEKLLRKKGAEVFMTRTEDKNVGLYDRMDAAFKAGAHLFISIHNNALPDGEKPDEHRGLGVYYYHPQSLEFARCLHNSLLKKTRQIDDGLIYDNLAVPRTTYMPSVLVEAAYIMHPEGEYLLRSEKFQKRFASGIYLGIKDYLESLK